MLSADDIGAVDPYVGLMETVISVEGLRRRYGEVDAVRWLTVDDAVEALTYRHDADLLGRLPDSL